MESQRLMMRTMRLGNRFRETTRPPGGAVAAAPVSSGSVPGKDDVEEGHPDARAPLLSFTLPPVMCGASLSGAPVP
jgi:hypothetical protein